MNNLTIGIDISTVVAGFSFFFGKEIAGVGLLKFDKSSSIEERVRQVVSYIQEKHEYFSKFGKLNITILIEENLYNFARGYTNSKALSKLLAINSMLSYALKYDLNINKGDVLVIKKINPRHARKLIGYTEKKIDVKKNKKEKILIFMSDKYPNILHKILSHKFFKKNNKYVYDVIDATVLALAYLENV